MDDEKLIHCLRLALRAIKCIETPDRNDIIDLRQALEDAKAIALDALLLRSDRESLEAAADD